LLQYQFLLIETQIKDILLRSCQNSLKEFKVLHRIPSEKDEPHSALLGDETKKDMPFTQEATIKTHFRRLRKYARLVDYLYLSAQLQMINNSTQTLAEKLADFKPQISAQLRSNTWIILKISVLENELEFIPDQAQMLRLVKSIVVQGVECICNRTRYFSQRQEIRYFMDREVEPSEFTEIQQVAQNDQQIAATMENFENVSLVAVNVMQMYYDYISPFMQIYKQNINLQPLEDRIDLQLFKELIVKYQQQDTQLNVIEPRVEIGMFQIDASRLKELIKNCASDCLQSIYKQIPAILLRKAKEYLDLATDLN
jgi:dynein heavy chain